MTLAYDYFLFSGDGIATTEVGDCHEKPDDEQKAGDRSQDYTDNGARCGTGIQALIRQRNVATARVGGLAWDEKPGRSRGERVVGRNRAWVEVIGGVERAWIAIESGRYRWHCGAGRSCGLFAAQKLWRRTVLADCEDGSDGGRRELGARRRGCFRRGLQWERRERACTVRILRGHERERQGLCTTTGSGNAMEQRGAAVSER